MDVDEQVAVLMQGTEYGDDALKNAMAGELRQRLVEAGQEGRPLRVYCGYDPRTTDLHLGPYRDHAQAAPVPGFGT